MLDTKVVASALIGYLVYAARHFAFHVGHFGPFTFAEAFGVGTGLGTEVLLALVLLYVCWRVHRAEAAVGPGA